MKKFIPLLVVLAVVITGLVLYRGDFLQSQVLNQQPQIETFQNANTVEDCKKLSQNLANRCFRRIALEENDASICDQISRPTEKQRCQREVDIAR